MPKYIKYILTTTWILFSRSYDAYCTNILTPDLSKEANPLVSVVGISSWSTLLIILGILTVYALYAFYISLFKPIDLMPKEKGYSFGNFVAYIYLGYKDKWIATLYKLPKDIKRLNTYLGNVLTLCLVYAGCVSTIMWLLINHTLFYKKIHSASLIYATLIGGCFLIIYYWNKTLYKKYIADSN